VEAQKSDGVELLELNKLTVEQVRERQGRLAKMRNLMFCHELKAKHIKKIKSKTYHRLLKKERVKAGLGEIPNDPEVAKEYAMKQEFDRAEERMTLKHKNTSKWAKKVLKRGLEKQDEGTRAAIAEQLHLNTLLSRKIHSMNESSSNDESSSEDDDNAEITLRSEITNVENSSALPMSIPFPYQKLNNVDGGHYQHQRQEQSKEARGRREAALGLRRD
jgi:U3 small nucleolar RNA-associated protein 14